MRTICLIAALACPFPALHAGDIDAVGLVTRLQIPAARTYAQSAPPAPPATPSAIVQPPATQAGGQGKASPGIDSTDSNLGVGLGLGISTAGMGGHVTLPIAPQRLHARFGINYFQYSYNGHADKVDFEFKLTLNTYDALLDWYPFAGNFRFTTGVVYNASQIAASGKPGIAGHYVINGHTYRVDDIGQLEGRLTFPAFVPYLGLGYGNTLDTGKRWTIYSDTGLLLHSSPVARIRSGNCSTHSGVCGTLERDIDTLNGSLNKHFRFFKAYPVMRAGIAYRF